MTIYLIDGKEARDKDYAFAIESLPTDGSDYVGIGLPDGDSVVISAVSGGFLVTNERPDGSSWAARSMLTRDQVEDLVASFVSRSDEWREGLAWEPVILPSRGGGRLRRLDRAVGRLASWSSWRCPLGALVLVIGAQLSSSSWWRVVCCTLATALVVLLFSSYGIAISLGSLTCQRPDRWFEKVFALCGVLGGAALMALGLAGAWAFLRSAVLGR